jgi:hypothetical protein
MMTFVLACITPFLTAAGLDPDQALIAARQAMEAYTGSPLQTGQAVAFALASLDSLRHSTQAELSPTMRLRFRGSANALNKTAVHHATACETKTGTPADDEDSAPPDPEADAAYEAETIAALKEAEILLGHAEKAADPRREHNLRWASTILQVAADHVLELPDMLPPERGEQAARIAGITSAARELITGEPSDPRKNLPGQRG